MKNFTRTLKISTNIILIIALMFFVLEPAVVSSQIENQHTVSQVITSEISFIVPSSNVNMSPSIAGITGGTSNGSTYVRVLTNNATGYNMTLTASSSLGMIGNTQGGTIPALIPTVGIVPNYLFNTVAPNVAAFGYTVEASTTPDLAQAFLDNGSNTCNTGSTDTVDSCWVNASTTARTIINRSSETSGSGATTTIKYRVIVANNPLPSIPQDTYVATTTLTAVINP